MNALLQQLNYYVSSIASSLEGFDDACASPLLVLREKLQLPSQAVVLEAASAAYRDTLQAFWSCGALFLVVGRPTFLLLRMILTPLLHCLWRVLARMATFLRLVVVPCVQRHGGRHLRLVARRVYDFHAQRSASELVLEAGVVLLLYGAWRLYQHVKAHRWVARAKEMVLRPVRKIKQCYRHILHHLQQSYQQLVARVAAVSSTCALALPHFLYWMFAALVSHPSVLGRASFGAMATEYLATQTPLISLLQVGYPLWETLSCILQIEATHKAEPGRRRNREQKQLEERQLCQLQCVLDYWTIYSALQLCGALLSSLPLVSYYLLQSMALQVTRLWFALWLSALLYLAVHYSHTLHTASPTPHSDQSAPQRHPMFKLVADGLVEHVGGQFLHGVVPRATWQRLLLQPITPLLDLVVTIKLLSPPWRDKLLQALEEVRVLVVPLFLCFAPLVSVWAVRYAQYVMPLSKFATSTQQKLHRRASRTTTTKALLQCAQYWALHIGLSRFITYFLPFSILRFLVWWYLSWPTTIEWVWEWTEREVGLGVDVLLGDAAPTDSAVVRAIHAFVDRLPKAASTAATDSSSSEPSDGQQEQAAPPGESGALLKDNHHSEPLDAENGEGEEEEHFMNRPAATPPSTSLRRSPRLRHTRATT